MTEERKMDYSRPTHPPFEWNKELENKLLAAVKKRPCLYRKNKPCSKKVREENWMSLADEIGIPEGECYYRFKKIRNPYHKAKKLQFLNYDIFDRLNENQDNYYPDESTNELPSMPDLDTTPPGTIDIMLDESDVEDQVNDDDDIDEEISVIPLSKPIYVFKNPQKMEKSKNTE